MPSNHTTHAHDNLMWFKTTCFNVMVYLAVFYIYWRLFIKKNIENALKANKQTKHPFFLLTCPQQSSRIKQDFSEICFRTWTTNVSLTLSWRRPLCRNQSIDLQSKSMDWFLNNNDLFHKRVNNTVTSSQLELDIVMRTKDKDDKL